MAGNSPFGSVREEDGGQCQRYFRVIDDSGNIVAEYDAVDDQIAFFGSSLTGQASSLTSKDTGTVDTTYGASERDVIKNNRTRIDELETRLSNYGLLP